MQEFTLAVGQDDQRPPQVRFWLGEVHGDIWLNAVHEDEKGRSTCLGKFIAHAGRIDFVPFTIHAPLLCRAFGADMGKSVLARPIPNIADDSANLGCLFKRQPGEPMFILLGRDPDAGNITRLWAERRAAAGDPDHASDVFEIADAMDLWEGKPKTSPAPDAYPPMPNVLRAERPTGGPGIRISHSDALGFMDMLRAGQYDHALNAMAGLIDSRKAEVEDELHGDEFERWIKRYCGEQSPASMRFTVDEMCRAFYARHLTPIEPIGDVQKQALAWLENDYPTMMESGERASFSSFEMINAFVAGWSQRGYMKPEPRDEDQFEHDALGEACEKLTDAANGEPVEPGHCLDLVERLREIDRNRSATFFGEIGDHVVKAALDEFNGGLVRQPDKSNSRGYVDHYWPKVAMKNAIVAALTKRGGLPADVVRLVLAAREVAFGEIGDRVRMDNLYDDVRGDIEELDKASEAFASRVPWDDEPEFDCDEPEETITVRPDPSRPLTGKEADFVIMDELAFADSSPARIARQFYEDLVPPAMRPAGWDQHWDAMIAYCEQPVAEPAILGVGLDGSLVMGIGSVAFATTTTNLVPPFLGGSTTLHAVAEGSEHITAAWLGPIGAEGDLLWKGVDVANSPSISVVWAQPADADEDVPIRAIPSEPGED